MEPRIRRAMKAASTMASVIAGNRTSWYHGTTSVKDLGTPGKIHSPETVCRRNTPITKVGMPMASVVRTVTTTSQNE